MNRYRSGTLERIKLASGLHWYLRYTDTDGSRPRLREGGKPVRLPVSKYPSQTAAWKGFEPYLRRLNATEASHRTTFGDLIDKYEAEAMPERHSTRLGYQSMINFHIRPRWGKTPLADVRAYEVRAWLMGLKCGSRRKGHIHGLMRVLFRFAMLWEWLPAVENPMRLFSLQGATKRTKTPGTLTHAQFHRLLEKVPGEPYRTMIVLAQALGLRISELFALQWRDIDHLEQTVRIERAIVDGHVGFTKSERSGARLPLHPYLAKVLLAWYSKTEFKDEEHYVFASPWQAGELPYNASKIQSAILRKAGKEIGLTFSLGWHTFRHTYRALLRQSGAAMDVQRDLMRHADIQTTMQTYGGTGLEELRGPNETVVESLFGGKQ